MKREKDSITPARTTSQRCSNKAERHELCPYFDNLPSQLTTHILLKLPMKSLLICRCVCKIWNTLISEPHFAKLQFEQAPVSLMIRSHDTRRTRNLYIHEFQPEKFEIGSKNLVKLEPLSKLPLRDAKYYSDKNGVKSYKEKSDEIKNKSKHRFIACTTDRDMFNIVNSCNGLLCLSKPDIGSPLVICNPVTSEFIRLPELTLTSDWLNTARVQAGFGFQPKTNEYKVISMWNKHVRRSNRLVFERVVLMIHTLGTPSWRNVEVDPQISFLTLLHPTCVNGALHWIIYEDCQQKSILCFCFESERLQLFPSPPHVFGNHDNEFPVDNKPIRLGELKGFLYICDRSSTENLTMWVMNEYGIGESWTKVYNIHTSPAPLTLPDRWRCGLCWLVKQKYGFKVFRIGIISMGVEIIPHIPSLISLTDAVKGGNVEVLNILHSRFEDYKWLGENEYILFSQRFV